MVVETLAVEVQDVEVVAEVAGGVVVVVEGFHQAIVPFLILHRH